MNSPYPGRQRPAAGSAGRFLCAALVLLTVAAGMVAAGWPWKGWWRSHKEEGVPCTVEEGWAGQWYWLRSPDEEKRVIMGLYNRYCIRCHGVDGRGVWDIPDVPDFTNARWQACRSDAQLARTILEGRGAVMPPFRGTLTLEEAWAMARYLRTFLPGAEASRPDVGEEKPPANKSGTAGPVAPGK